MPDGYKTCLNNTTSGILASNLCGRKYLREEANLHFAPFFLSNIQADNSSSACNTKNRLIPVVLPRNHPRDSHARGRKNSNLVTLNRTHDHKKLNEYGVGLLLANTHVACTNDEVKCVILYVNPALFTETWLRDSIIENHLHMSGYHLTARNRTTDPHGGVSLLY